MITEFIDTEGASDHNRFQAWRTNNQKGTCLTIETRTRANLHGVRCQHFGSGPPYYSAEAGFGSLTSERKVCGWESDLLAWARQNGLTVKRCLHCVRSGLVRPEPSGIDVPQGVEGTSVPSPRNYWIIKAKPERNDFTKYPLRGESGRWYTSQIPKAWRVGDTLFIWAGSPMLRVIGRARLTNPNDGFDHNTHHFRVEYLTNRIDGPTIATLRKDPQLRTASFLKSGPAGTVFPLTSEQGSRMLQLMAPFPESLPSGASKRPTATAVGAGFGTAEDNRKVERAAVAAAKKYYEAQGWSVQSVEIDKVGFDLRCQKGRQVRHIEVKGVSGSGCGFILTQGEYQKAASDGKYELCLIELALSSPKITIFKRGEMFEAFEFVPLAYKAVRAPEVRGAVD